MILIGKSYSSILCLHIQTSGHTRSLRQSSIALSRALRALELLLPVEVLVCDSTTIANVVRALRADKEIICSCGSGVTACILALGLHLMGHQQVKIYDGSWTEWGSRHDLSLETGK